MNYIQSIIYFCSSIMNTRLYLCGYSITLWQVTIFGFVVFVIGTFIFKLLR